VYNMCVQGVGDFRDILNADCNFQGVHVKVSTLNAVMV